MSRKRNSGRGKKARDYGSAGGGGMSKHRTSGQTQINRRDRIIACRDRNRAEDIHNASKRPEMFDSVRELFGNGE